MYRGLYGLNDAAQVCFELFRKTVKKAGPQELESLLCVYTQKKNIVILCHGEDIAMFAKHQLDSKKLKQILEKQFTLRDLGKQVYFVVVEIN